jgi:hypothetical protein
MVDICVVIGLKCERTTFWPGGSAWVWVVMYCLNSCEPDEYELHCEGLLE